MNDIVEIRWHGRGGQGAKTASLLLADAAFNTGKYVQGFPEYGPERMGAPITAYNRISSERSTVHSNIYYPDLRGSGLPVRHHLPVLSKLGEKESVVYKFVTSSALRNHLQ